MIGWEKEREEKIKKIGRSENRVAKDGKLVDAMKMNEEEKVPPQKKLTVKAGTEWFTDK